MLLGMPVAGADSSSIQTPGTGIRVMLVADYDIFDRFGRMVHQLAVGLARDGVRVGLLTDDPASAAQFVGTPIACHWVRFLSGWLAPLRTGRFLDRLAEKPEVVHVWGTVCLDAIAPWAARAGIPIFVHVLSTADVQEVLQPRWRGRIHALAGSESLRLMLGRATAVQMLDAADFSPAIVPPARPAKEDDDERVLGVLWAGRLAPEAGLELLLQAVAMLRDRSCDLQLALIGAGSSAGALRRHIREAGIADRVSLIEEPDIWEPAVSGVDVCVVPARQDEIHLAPLLAMALGKIVIASRDQPAEWFVENQTSWQFAPGSAAELADCLERAAGAGSAGLELRNSACKYVATHHTLERLVNTLQRAYAGCTSTTAVSAR
jgi:glycosyltransferase involved in cell wall biosynthesis